jgi:Zn-dependent M28 family amino/carboxypeptidase
MAVRFFLLIVLAAAAACGREPGLFVESNARAHVGMLAGTIGSRPVGSPANAKAREYIVDQLKQIGFDVRVQEIDARRHEFGTTARVANIIGVLAGERAEAVGLVTHYDSSPDAPGATDAALGVGVALEAARVFSAQPRRRWSLLVLITDGEESGLMGAAGLVTDRSVIDRLQAYINLESIGSSGTPVLFETGPANAWIVSPWARRAPHPRGGSYALEIYQRLPNDTDFSILATRGVPGLNFAPIGDSYAYHTARDTVDRLSRGTIRDTGENVAGILAALQDTDITRRTDRTATYFDIGGA